MSLQAASNPQILPHVLVIRFADIIMFRDNFPPSFYHFCHCDKRQQKAFSSVSLSKC